MVGELIRLKLTMNRHALRGRRSGWAVTGAALGVVIALGACFLAMQRLNPASLVPDLLAVTYLTWFVGWAVGPIMTPGPPLRAAHLAMVPLPRRRLALGLLTAGFVGVATAVTLVLFASLVVYASRFGLAAALFAAVLMVLQLVAVVLFSKIVQLGFGRLARSRAGAALNGILLALVLVLTTSGWMVVVGLMSSGILRSGLPVVLSEALRWAPSGWSLAAVELAADGLWLPAWLIAAALLALSAALFAVWGITLGEARGDRAVVRGSAGIPSRRISPVRALALKELRSWWRDPARTAALSMPLAWGVLTAVLPLSFGMPGILPWAGTLVALMATTTMINMYAYEGTGVWLTVQSGMARVDVRARQLAFLVAYCPAAIALTVGLTAASGQHEMWPWTLAATLGTLGGGAGLIAYTSVFMAEPGPDARDRVENPTAGGEEFGTSILSFLAAMIPPAPGLVIVYLGVSRGDDVLAWAGVAVGMAVGAVVAWMLGGLAGRRLERQGPELLLLMRSGRQAASARADGPGEGSTAPARSTIAKALIMALWAAGVVALVPQGLLTIVLKVTGAHDVRVWFLAMYAPEPWGWLTSLGMIALGGGLTWIAYRLGKSREG